MRVEKDFLVIGSGIAGLSYALKVAEHGKVLIITKDKLNETNTQYAQGGIATVMYHKDNFEKHINDTIIAGDGLCNKKIVEMVVKEAPERIQDLVDWGVSFDKKSDGSYDLGREGGHSEYRVLHHKDNTGFEIQKTLSFKAQNHPNIEIWEYHFAIDFITQHHLGKLVKKGDKDTQCFGAYSLNLKTNEIITILSKVTLVATGGSGNVYNATTNPLIATGDGVAMAYRAKADCENLEFFQFHPTALYDPGKRPSYLITEALRGFGAILKTHEDKEFMHLYDERGSLAPRDIVARAIDNEMKKNGVDFLYLDCRHIPESELQNHFPNIFLKCLSLGINISKDLIPVVPSAHYQCGGISVNNNGETVIHHLFAVGEVASTGLHGANRLASNSLLEAVVFAHRAANISIEQKNNISLNRDIPLWNSDGKSHPAEKIIITQNIKEVQEVMSNYVGVVRSNKRLERAMSRLKLINEETENIYTNSLMSKQLCELRNLINVAYLITKEAMLRKESIGLHYNIDYPKNES